MRSQEEEEGRIPAPVHFPDWVPAVARARGAVAQDVLVQLSRRFLEGLAVRRLPPRTVSKLLKEAPLSARRKALRRSFAGLPCWRRAEAMAGTAFRSHLILSASEFGVKVAMMSWRLCTRREEGQSRLRVWVHHTTYLLVRAAASAAGAAAGAAAVMLLLPADHPRLAQYSVLVGALLGDLAGTTVVGSSGVAAGLDV